MPSPAEIMRKMNEFERRRLPAQEKLRSLARVLLPMLRDHKLENVAGELGAILFELDAIEQEQTAMLSADPEATMAFIKTLVSRR